jgi:hypothetical protein
MTEKQFANITVKIWRLKQHISDMEHNAPFGTFMDRRRVRSLRAIRARRAYDYAVKKLDALCLELAGKA